MNLPLVTLRRVAVNTGGNVVSQVIAAITTFVIASHLGPAGFGAYAAPLASVALFVFLFNWGLDAWLLREGALAARPRVLIASVLTTKVILCVLMAGPVFLILRALNTQLFAPAVVFALIADAAMESLFRASTVMLTATRRVPAAVGLRTGLFLLRLIAVLALVVVADRNPIDFAIGRACATAVFTALAVVLARPQAVSDLLRAPLRLVRQSSWFAGSELLGLVFAQADLTIIATFIGDAASAGIYSPAISLISSTLVIPTAAQMIVLPALTSRFRDGHARRFAQIRQTYAGFTILGIGLSLGAWLVAEALLFRVLGAAYTETGDILAILAPSLFFRCVTQAGTSTLVAVGHQRLRLVAQTIAVVGFFAVTVWLLPALGIRGMAWAHVAGEAMLAVAVTGAAFFKIRSMRQSQ